MTINRNEHQPLGINGVKFRDFIQIHEAMLGEILDISRPLLERLRHLFHKFLMPRRLSDLFAERVKAIVRVTRQYKYRDWIGFVEPQQNCAFKLAYCRSLLVRHKKRRAKTRFGLFARFPTHFARRLATYSRPLSVRPYEPDVSTQSPIAPNPLNPTPVCWIRPERTKQ